MKPGSVVESYLLRLTAYYGLRLQASAEFRYKELQLQIVLSAKKHRLPSVPYSVMKQVILILCSQWNSVDRTNQKGKCFLTQGRYFQLPDAGLCT